MSLWFAPVAATALLAGAPAPSPPPAAYAAPCPSGVAGGLPADYERSSLVAGPLALYAVRGYADYPARFIASVRANLRRDLRSFEGRRLTRRERRARARTRSALRRASAHRYPAFEAAAAIQPGHTVTIGVAPADRAHVGFLFDNRSWRHSVHGYRVADGTPAVTFRGCTTERYAQYQGGFVADGPRCATLEAWIDGAREPERRVVSFGSGDCGVPEQTRPGGPPPPPLALGPTPAGIHRACARARLRCPARWPLRPGSRPHGGRDFARGPAALLSFSDTHVEGEGGHLLLGDRPRAYDLRGRPGGRFARRGRDPLRVPSRRRTERTPGGGRYVTESPARILRRATVRGRPALVLAAPPYPRGGLHGDHVIVLWNVGGRGRLVSLHFRDELDPGRYDREDRIRAAVAVAAA